MEYALVNIVMGDIADIEKKKSMGISNLILGSRGLPIRQKEGGINQEVKNWTFFGFSRVKCNWEHFWKLFIGLYSLLKGCRNLEVFK